MDREINEQPEKNIYNKTFEMLSAGEIRMYSMKRNSIKIIVNCQNIENLQQRSQLNLQQRANPNLQQRRNLNLQQSPMIAMSDSL